MTLVELLAQLAGAELSFQRKRQLIAVALLVLPGGRQVLLSERTYRDGIHVLLDPTPEEVETARIGSLGQIWSSDRLCIWPRPSGRREGCSMTTRTACSVGSPTGRGHSRLERVWSG
jgi:hypothetical protein